MNLLSSRLFKTVLAIVALAAFAMLVGFSGAAEPTTAMHSVSGEMLFYTVLGVFDVALIVGLIKIARQ